MPRRYLFTAAAACLLAAIAWSAMAAEKTAQERLDVYAPVELGVPWELLDEMDRAALAEIYRAAEVMDEIFLRQVWAGNVEMRETVRASGDPGLLRLFQINFGPWDRIDDNAPFIGDLAKPDGADFYPPDMAKEEFAAWIAAHPGDREAFESAFTVIRRGPGGGLVAVPYSVEYGELLLKAAGHLRSAADLAGNESLARFLRSRADAFFSNDYFQSDMDWMDVAGNVIDVTIGPYEVYEDNLFNYKAAFEAFVCIRDPEESRRLDGLKGYLTRLEMNLPIPDGHKNLARGSESPISVVDEVFSAGDTKSGVQTLAFNLPNDERVQEAKGSKKVMLRNIIHAKFDKILVPIAERVIAKEQLPGVTFDAYYNHILLHEFSHGLGPGRITLADGTETTAQKALKECHSAIEEAKADIVGEHNIYYLIDDGFFGRGLESEAAVTFLAGFF
ncbi:MAG: peptidase, partial [Candidatus Krumholzibacteria bacterium]|nr:peptidase [Candidatus Krumholzibacteria bacterium]